MAQSASKARLPVMHPPKGAWAAVHAPPPKGSWAPVHPPAGLEHAIAHPPAMTLQLAVVVLVLLVAPNLPDILHRLRTDMPALPFPYSQLAAYNLAAILLALLGAGCLRGGLPRPLGLSLNGWRGPVLTLLATVPCWVGFALTGPVSRSWEDPALLLPVLLTPLSQELVFRGFGFVFTRRALRWYVAFAMLLQALVFSLIPEISDWLGGGAVSPARLQLMLIPFLGGLLFAVLDLLDGYTLWCSWIWRISVGAAFTVFAVSPSSLPGALANILPAASGVLAILLLLIFVPREHAH